MNGGGNSTCLFFFNETSKGDALQNSLWKVVLFSNEQHRQCKHLKIERDSYYFNTDVEICVTITQSTVLYIYISGL